MTDERKALVKRLYGDLPDTMFEGHNVTDYDAVIRQNHEAADHIEAQALEIERLSYALGCITNEDWKDMTVGSARDLARAALGESHE